MTRPGSEAGMEREARESEVASFFRQLEIVAKVIGRDYGLKVVLGKPGAGSSFNEEENEITIDPVLLTPERFWEAENVVVHEGGHRAITKGPKTIGLKEEEIIEIYSQLGFPYLKNVQEDITVDSWVMQKFEGTKEAYKKFYDQQFPRENTIILNQEVEQFIALLGYEPKFAHYGGEIMRYWHTGKFSEKLDPDVEAAIAATHEAMKQAYGKLPGILSGDRERIANSKERFGIVLNEVWPEVKKLVEKDLDTEKARQMIKEYLAAQEALAKAMLQELMNFLGKELKEELEEHLTSVKEGEGEVPIGKFSEELKEKLKEFFNGLPKPEQKKFEEKAKQTLGELEDKMNQATEGQLNEDNAPTHEEIEAEAGEGATGGAGAGGMAKKEGEQKSEKPGEADKGAKKEKKEKKKENEEAQTGEGGLTLAEVPYVQREKKEYDLRYKEVYEGIENLRGRLERIFRPERKPRWKGGYETGERLDIKKAMAEEADESETKLWQKKTVPKKLDYGFELVVDLSGSMEDKIDIVMKGVIMVAETLDRMDIPNGMVGFGKKVLVPEDFYTWKIAKRQEFIKEKENAIYKKFGEKLDEEEARPRIAQMLRDTGGGTPTAEVTAVASKILEENKRKHTFIITFTDGQPNDHEELRRKIEEARKKGQKLVGIGLGPGTEFVANFYKASVVVEDVSQLSDASAELFEDMIRNPEKYD